LINLPVQAFQVEDSLAVGRHGELNSQNVVVVV